MTILFTLLVLFCTYEQAYNKSLKKKKIWEDHHQLESMDNLFLYKIGFRKSYGNNT